MRSSHRHWFPITLAVWLVGVAGCSLTVGLVAVLGGAGPAPVEYAAPAPLEAHASDVPLLPPPLRSTPKKTALEPTTRPAAPPLRRSSLPFTLKGSLVSATAEWSMATLEDVRTRRMRTVMEGEQLEGARVVAIHRSLVVVEADGVRAFIDQAPPGTAPVMTAISDPSRHAPPVGPSRGEPSRGATGALPGLRQNGKGSWSVPRNELEALAANPMALMNDARILPSFENGAADGFKLSWLRPGSLYSRIGLQPGDVLRRVNGLSLDSHEKMLLAYQQLREARQIELEVIRNGATVRHTYRVE